MTLTFSWQGECELKANISSCNFQRTGSRVVIFKKVCILGAMIETKQQNSHVISS